MTTVLTIAGSDPTGGAGIQADLRVFEQFGIKGLSAITAITAQTDRQVLSLYPTPADILTQQLSAVSEGVKIDVIKIGMIATAANVQAIIWFLKRYREVPLVVDPIIDSSSGFPLLEPAALPLFEQHLLPLATVVTPNLMEAGTLAGMQVSTLETMKTAAKTIFENICKLGGGCDHNLHVVITGGHLREISTDILFDGNNITAIEGERVDAKLHGSGCLYSSSLAAALALGSSVSEAAKKAKTFVTEKLKASQQNVTP
jgi:hydroxymethylpyrimidine/phosphomethylpyrimidine kinase